MPTCIAPFSEQLRFSRARPSDVNPAIERATSKQRGQMDGVECSNGCARKRLARAQSLPCRCAAGSNGPRRLPSAPTAICSIGLGKLAQGRCNKEHRVNAGGVR